MSFDEVFLFEQNLNLLNEKLLILVKKNFLISIDSGFTPFLCFLYTNLKKLKIVKVWKIRKF